RLFDPDYQGHLDASKFETNPTIHGKMDPRDLEHLVALYDGEIRFVDESIGRLVEELEQRGLMEKTLLVITGDHGDEFFEHNEKGHGHSLYQELLHVPLLIHSPVLGGGFRVPQPVALIDVAPTILDFLGIPLPEKPLEGCSLLGLLQAPSSWPARPIWSETRRARKDKQALIGRTARSMLFDRFKGIHYQAEDSRPDLYEYYDLKKDPKETHPLPEAYLQENGFPDFPRKIAEWKAKDRENRDQNQEAPLDQDTLKALKELGY
ncbi:MAG: sulfatase-like hydrolase/transferase, partial [Planctomycetes bacterium]|nr:sulfatase-like hydrolase/transferase [Planctomycetota bacterium]